MKKTALIILCIAIFLSLVGCSAKITEGEVYEKEYREAHTETRLMPTVRVMGKTTTTILIPYTYFYPERYVIHIKAFYDEKWITEDYYVSKEVYDAVNIGDIFVYEVERGDLQDEPYTRERGRSDNEKS